MAYELNTTVRGGLPVTIEFETESDYSGAYVESWWISEVDSRPCKKSPEWLYKGISEAESARIMELCEQYMYDWSHE